MGARLTVFAGCALLAAAAPSWGEECATVDGQWATPGFDVFVLSQDASGNITGTAHPQPGQSCPTYAISGSMNAGSFTWWATATSQPGEGCATAHYGEGHVIKPGCQIASPYDYISGGYGGYWTGQTTLVRSSCQLPSLEVTTPLNWDDQFGGFPTVYRWHATLQPTSFNFGGRTVGEDNPGGANDTCHFVGSDIPYQNDVSFGSAPVENNGYDDQIGWPPAAVAHYRATNRAPCSMSTVQRMFIDCFNGNTAYQYNALEVGIGTTTVWSSRAGQTKVRTYP